MNEILLGLYHLQYVNIQTFIYIAHHPANTLAILIDSSMHIITTIFLLWNTIIAYKNQLNYN